MTDNTANMPHLKLTVLSLRYSSWSMRPWLALAHAGAMFATETVELKHMQQQADFSKGTINMSQIEPMPLSDRRNLGSVHALFPVLRVDDIPIHKSSNSGTKALNIRAARSCLVASALLMPCISRC